MLTPGLGTFTTVEGIRGFVDWGTSTAVSGFTGRTGYQIDDGIKTRGISYQLFLFSGGIYPWPRYMYYTDQSTTTTLPKYEEGRVWKEIYRWVISYI